MRNNPKGPQVIISRTRPEFLARLFELEVPEIFDKTVKIVKVVRDPGFRSKIAVTTSDEPRRPGGRVRGHARQPRAGHRAGAVATSASTSSTGPTNCRSWSAACFRRPRSSASFLSAKRKSW